MKIGLDKRSRGWVTEYQGIQGGITVGCILVFSIQVDFISEFDYEGLLRSVAIEASVYIPRGILGALYGSAMLCCSWQHAWQSEQSIM